MFKQIVWFSVAGSVFLSACSSIEKTDAEWQRVPVTYFSCETDVLEARFSEDRLFLQGFSFADEFVQTVSASGVRYESDQQRSFWTKGTEALLQTGEFQTQRCVQVDAPSASDVIDVPFQRAAGNEPFWTITVDQNTAHWRTLSGESDAYTLSSRTNWAPGLFTVSDESNTLTLLVSSAQCRDTMSGTLFPFSVNVNKGNQSYAGCAGSAVAMVFGEWRLVAVDELPAPATATLTFGDENNVFGSDGCNRFMGGYQVNEGFSVTPLASTRMACIDTETNQFANRFLTALQTANAIERPDADTLIIVSASGARIMAQRQ